MYVACLWVYPLCIFTGDSALHRESAIHRSRIDVLRRMHEHGTTRSAYRHQTVITSVKSFACESPTSSHLCLIEWQACQQAVLHACVVVLPLQLMNEL